MTIIKPVRRDAEHPRRIKKHSAPLRLWHWANAIVISGSLITVLINSTIDDQRPTTNLIKNAIQKTGLQLSDNQAGAASHAIRHRIWDFHAYFGYCLAGLLVFRLALEFFQVVDQKLARKLKIAYAKFNITKKHRQVATHELCVKIIYALFYLLLTIMVVTGLSLAFDDIAFIKPFRHLIIKVHGFGMYLILAFITVHLIGVFLAERKDSKGIVSDMINGGQ